MIKWDKKKYEPIIGKRVTESNDIMPRCIEKLKLQQLCNMVFLISDIPFSHTLTHIYNCSVKQLIELMKKITQKITNFQGDYTYCLNY